MLWRKSREGSLGQRGLQLQTGRTEKTTSEQRPGGREEGSSVALWWRSVPGRGNCEHKGPERGGCLVKVRQEQREHQESSLRGFNGVWGACRGQVDLVKDFQLGSTPHRWLLEVCRDILVVPMAGNVEGGLGMLYWHSVGKGHVKHPIMQSTVPHNEYFFF